MNPIEEKQPAFCNDIFTEILTCTGFGTLNAFSKVSKNCNRLAKLEFDKRKLPKQKQNDQKSTLCVCFSKIRIQMDQPIDSDLRQKIYKNIEVLPTKDQYCYAVKSSFNEKPFTLYFFKGTVKSNTDTMIANKFDAIVYPIDFASSNSVFDIQMTGIKHEINRNRFFTAKQFVIRSSEDNQERQNRIDNEIHLPCIVVEKNKEYSYLINEICVKTLGYI